MEYFLYFIDIFSKQTLSIIYLLTENKIVSISLTYYLFIFTAKGPKLPYRIPDI